MGLFKAKTVMTDLWLPKLHKTLDLT